MKTLLSIWRAICPRKTPAILADIRELIEELEYNADFDLRLAESIEAQLNQQCLRAELRPFAPLNPKEHTRAIEMRWDATALAASAKASARIANSLRESLN